jgi:molybdate transport system ATP-binding protein
MLHIQFDKQQGSFRLSMHVEAASRGVIALFGRSGCGKSTTVNLIAGLQQPDDGLLQLDDDVLFDSSKAIDLPSERRRIGYVFQDARLFPHYDVSGNLRYGLRRTKLHQPAKQRHPLRFDTIVELLGLNALLQRHPYQLSGGEKQRVALGRALLSQPRLLLLDEPLASLDQARRAEVLPYLERVRDELNIPMVYVSHQFEEVLQLATHVVLMDNGAVAAQGNLPNISHHPALRDIIGAEALGTVIESEVRSIAHHTALAQLGVGSGHLHVDANSLRLGQRVRLQLLARDLILALNAPVGMSVRNMLSGVVTHIQPDERNAVLVQVDIGGVALVARVTQSAAHDLQLHTGLPLWVLVKAVTLRGHVYHGSN